MCGFSHVHWHFCTYVVFRNCTHFHGGKHYFCQPLCSFLYATFILSRSSANMWPDAFRHIVAFHIFNSSCFSSWVRSSTRACAELHSHLLLFYMHIWTKCCARQSRSPWLVMLSSAGTCVWVRFVFVFTHSCWLSSVLFRRSRRPRGPRVILVITLAVSHLAHSLIQLAEVRCIRRHICLHADILYVQLTDPGIHRFYMQYDTQPTNGPGLSSSWSMRM